MNSQRALWTPFIMILGLQVLSTMISRRRNIGCIGTTVVLLITLLQLVGVVAMAIVIFLPGAVVE
jgi:hypothetical protein